MLLKTITQLIFIEKNFDIMTLNLKASLIITFSFQYWIAKFILFIEYIFLNLVYYKINIGVKNVSAN